MVNICVVEIVRLCEQIGGLGQLPDGLSESWYDGERERVSREYLVLSDLHPNHFVLCNLIRSDEKRNFGNRHRSCPGFCKSHYHTWRNTTSSNKKHSSTECSGDLPDLGDGKLSIGIGFVNVHIV